MLRKDSRMSMMTVGEKLNISKATVSRRVSRLEEEKIITGHSLELDPSKLDVMKAFLGIQVLGSSVSHVIDELKKHDEVMYIYKAFGDHHLVCEVCTKSVADLYEMIQFVLLRNPSIKSVDVDALVERIPVNENADLKLYRSIKQPR
jgi:Lrp/AsnC family transcriptional regulator for asnA, asnC and gidA